MQASQPLEFIVTMDAEKMITEGMCRPQLRGTRYLPCLRSHIALVHAGIRKCMPRCMQEQRGDRVHND